MYSSTAVKSGGLCTFGPPLPEMTLQVRTPGPSQDRCDHCSKHAILVSNVLENHIAVQQSANAASLLSEL